MGGPEATLSSSPSVRQVVAFRLPLGSGSPLLQVLCYAQKKSGRVPVGIGQKYVRDCPKNLVYRQVNCLETFFDMFNLLL